MPAAIILPNLAVRPARVEDEADWERFVDLSDDATFYHHFGWRRVIERSLGHRCFYRCACRGNRFVGILPLVEVRSLLFGDALISLGFGVYGGIAAMPGEVAHALARDAASLGGHLSVDFVELRHRRHHEIDWESQSGRYVTFSRTLTPSMDDNFKATPGKRRSDLRKVLADNRLRFEANIEVADFYRVYSESLRNHGTPVLSPIFYHSIAQEFGPLVEFSGVYGPDGLLIVSMTFYFKNQAVVGVVGASGTARRFHVSDYLWWKLMERAVARGCDLFDFGRSLVGSGASGYKIRWGAIQEPLRYQYHLIKGTGLPQISTLNPKFRLGIATWKKLPLPLANRVGPFIARQIG